MNKSEKFWDRIAKKYSKQKVKDQAGYEKTLADTRKYLKREAAVLEIGCGTGTTALKLASSVKEFTATDISAKMITIAKEKAQEQGVGNVHFAQSTLFDENLKEGSFDAVLAFNLIHLLEDPENAIKRVNALLKPGGVFISKTTCLRENSRLWPILATIVGKFLGIPYLKSFTIAELKEFMAGQGFAIIDTHVYFPKPPRLFAVAEKR